MCISSGKTAPNLEALLLVDGLADKPGFVSPVRYRAGGGNHPSGNAVAGALKRPTRTHRASSPQTRPVWPCSGWGLPSRSGHPERWWYLTPPFHPYRKIMFQADHHQRRFLFCGTGLRVSPSGRYPPPCSAEPGLSSVVPLKGPNAIAWPTRPASMLPSPRSCSGSVPGPGDQCASRRINWC